MPTYTLDRSDTLNIRVTLDPATESVTSKDELGALFKIVVGFADPVFTSDILHDMLERAVRYYARPL